MSETIAAISTALMSSGIGVIRISGSDAFKIADKIFTSKNGKLIKDMSGYTATLGVCHDDDNIIDECIALVFHSPRSYTGEDVVEISCHGGVIIVKRILETIINHGARGATPGEFTKRAFLNGKLDLTKAEAVMDLIGAQGETARKAAFSQHEGALFNKINQIKKQLVDISADITAWIDFPDEGVPSLEPDVLKQNLTNSIKQIEQLKTNYQRGKVIKEGIETAIVGRPNVGKSTLMNVLTGYEKSIVTKIPGTTRDIVEENINFAGLILKLWDTAGIRETDDPIESIGVTRAKQKLDQAQLILAVFDGSQLLSDTDKELIEKIKNKNTIAIINKTDIDQKIDNKYIDDNINHVVYISADKGQGIDELEQKVLEITNVQEFDPGAAMIANARQLECVNKTYDGIKNALEAVEIGMTLDAVSVGIEDAINSLCELTGEKASEEIIDKVFEKFCIGK